MTDRDDNLITPPPWKLRGDAYILFYFFERDWLETLLSPDDFARWRGGVGAVAFIDYRASGVGAYGELLFIPGRLTSVDGKPRHSITKIYVSSQASIDSGRANWGIPKERAYFQREVQLANLDSIKMWVDGAPAFELSVTPGLVKLAANSRLCPIPLAQRLNGSEYRMRLSAAARVSLMEINTLTIDSSYFPDVSAFKPVGAIKLTNFAITFPKPKITPLAD